MDVSRSSAYGCHEHSTTQSHELSLSDGVLLLAFESVHEVDGLGQAFWNESEAFPAWLTWPPPVSGLSASAGEKRTRVSQRGDPVVPSVPD